MVFYLYSFNPCVSINENCKNFIAALIDSNIESGHTRWTPPIRVKGLDKETILILDWCNQLERYEWICSYNKTYEEQRK